MRPITITAHPRSRDVVVVQVPVEGNDDMKEMRHLATLNTDLHGYVIRKDRLDEFRAWADGIGWTLVEGGGPVTKAGHHTHPQECRTCGQPGSWGDPPDYCPACGTAWDPITPHDIENNEPRRMVTCDACGHRQPGRFPRCAHCGSLMHYERPTVVPQVVFDHHGEPVTVGEVLRRDWTRGGTPVLPTPHGPRFPPVHNGRPVVNVNLPDAPQPDEPNDPEPAEPEREPDSGGGGWWEENP